MDAPRKILLTTSRNPTHGIRTLCNDFAQVIPSIVRVNRGKMSTDEVAEKALELDAHRVVIVDRWHCGPGQIRFFRVGETGLISTPQIIRIAGIRLQREFGNLKVKPARSLVLLASNTSEEVSRFADAFSKLFGIPIMSMEEAVRTSPTLICISRDEFNRTVITFMVEPDHVEVGPRIVVSNVEW